jgi:hypothetical protein
MSRDERSKSSPSPMSSMRIVAGVFIITWYDKCIIMDKAQNIPCDIPF